MNNQANLFKNNMYFNFENNGNIPPALRLQTFPGLQFYQEFIRPFGLDYNNPLQFQQKLEGVQNIQSNEFSNYQKQLALMTQSIPHGIPNTEFGASICEPKPENFEIRNAYSKQNSALNLQNTNNLENANKKTKNLNSSKRSISRTSSISSIMHDDTQTLKIDCFDDSHTYVSTPSKSDANSSLLEDDEKILSVNVSSKHMISFETNYSWPKYNFTFDALDLCLYGYLKPPENKNLGYSISGIKLSMVKMESNTEKEKSESNCSIYDSNNKKSFVFSIDNLLTNSRSQSAQIMEIMNEKLNFELPEDIEIRRTCFYDNICNGMFCKKAIITKGTKFGPFPGKKIFPNEMKITEDNVSMWEIFTDGRLTHFISGNMHDNLNDASMSANSIDEFNQSSNYWMIYINCARFAQEQNMIAVQYQGEIFYEVCKDIGQGQELLVWYGDSYLQFLGIPVSLKDMTDEVNEDVVESTEGYSCDRCGKVFAYKYYRDKHLKYTRCVDQGDRKFPCHLCTRSFEKRDRLRIHILHVHEKHRPHKCSVCAKSFSQSSSLNKHMRVHSGERPYKCIYCNKAFTASSILRTHIRQHSGEKPFKCKYCGKAFASHAAHDSHVRRTHFLTKDKDSVDN